MFELICVCLRAVTARTNNKQLYNKRLQHDGVTPNNINHYYIRIYDTKTKPITISKTNKTLNE